MKSLTSKESYKLKSWKNSNDTDFSLFHSHFLFISSNKPYAYWYKFKASALPKNRKEKRLRKEIQIDFSCSSSKCRHKFIRNFQVYFMFLFCTWLSKMLYCAGFQLIIFYSWTPLTHFLCPTLHFVCLLLLFVLI